MTVPTFYRLSLALPIATPAVIGALWYWFRPQHLPDVMIFAATMVMVSVPYGGIPYAALALWTVSYIGDKPEAQIRRLVLTLPLLMSGLAAVFFTLIAGGGGKNVKDALALSTYGAIASVVLGYAYVGMVLLARSFVTLTENPEPKLTVQSSQF